MTIFGLNIMREKSTNTKFREIDKRFNNIEKSINKIDQRLFLLEHDVTDIKTDIKILLNKKGVN